MRPLSTASVRRHLAFGLAVAATAVALSTTSASASPTLTAPDPADSLVVSRLSISDGRGWLTLHARHSTAIGYEVRVPAGDGSWSGKTDVYLPEQDAHCRLQPGPDLHYVCLPGVYGFPSGSFAVSIPVTRTGGLEGLTGSARPFTATSVGYEDSFRVIDGSLYRSTAEVRAAPVTREAAGAEGRATLSVTTTIVPGETITALDVALPTGSWRITGSNTSNHGVRCTASGSGAGAPNLHCRPSATYATGLPAGRYNLVLGLGFTGEAEGEYSAVSLTASGLSPEPQDTFPWVTG